MNLKNEEKELIKLAEEMRVKTEEIPLTPYKKLNMVEKELLNVFEIESDKCKYKVIVEPNQKHKYSKRKTDTEAILVKVEYLSGKYKGQQIKIGYVLKRKYDNKEGLDDEIAECMAQMDISKYRYKNYNGKDRFIYRPKIKKRKISGRR